MSSPPGPPGICPPPCPPPCPPKKRLKKSCMELSSPPPSSSGDFCPPCPCGFLMVISVLMFTTVGSNWRAICENWLESCCGEGTVNGVASEVETAFSLPLTPADTTVPIKIPSDSVAKTTRVELKRLAFSLSRKPIGCGSIASPSTIKPNLKLYVAARNYCIGRGQLTTLV